MGGGTWAVGAGSSQAGKDWSSAGQSGRSWLLALPQIPTTGVSLAFHNCTALRSEASGLPHLLRGRRLGSVF